LGGVAVASRKSRVVLFAHDITTTAANPDLAFARLQLKATALNKVVALTCQ
jgi:hypothetical protein